jgi:hypothetical protein
MSAPLQVKRAWIPSRRRRRAVVSTAIDATFLRWPDSLGRVGAGDTPEEDAAVAVVLTVATLECPTEEEPHPAGTTPSRSARPMPRLNLALTASTYHNGGGYFAVMS